MTDIFDIPITDNEINQYLDRKANSLKFSAVLKDKKLITNILFRILFKNVLGIWPSRQHSLEFMNNATLNGDLDINQFILFLKRVIPLYNFISIDLNILTKLKTDVLNEINHDVNKIKDVLITKLANRFGMDTDKLETDTSVLNIYKKCIFDKHTLNNIKLLNVELSKIQNKSPIDIPIEIDTIGNYYKMSNEFVEYYQLYNYNVFSNYRNYFSKMKNDIIRIQQ
jgi:hypothetical protein